MGSCGWSAGCNGCGIRELFGCSPQAEPLDSIAILPLTNANLTGNSGEDYFAGAMTEALTTELTKIRALKVISQTSSSRYKDSKKPLPQIAKELGVKAIVEGSVAREGDQVRITVQLIEASTDTHLWAHSYQREMRNILALQAEVAQAIAREVRVKLTPQEQAGFATAPPANPKALEAYLRGLYYLWQWPREENFKSVAHFEKAIAIDPNFALAYARLAGFYVMADSIPPREALPKAKAYAMKSLQLDERLPDAHMARAMVAAWGEMNWSEAEREFQRTLELDAGHAALQEYAFLLGVLRRHREASALIATAKHRDPINEYVYLGAGRVSFLARNLDKAIEEVRAALALAPNEPLIRQDLGIYYHHAGRYTEAIAEFSKLVDETSRHPLMVSLLAGAKAKAGQTAEARKLLAEIRALARKEYVPPTWFVPMYLGLGEKDRVIEALEEAYKERDSYLLWLTSPWLDPIRDDPRYKDLLRRMNLPQALSRSQP